MLAKAAESWHGIVRPYLFLLLTHHLHLLLLFLTALLSPDSYPIPSTQVLCCPGAWCMYRVEALEALLPNYCQVPTSIREFHRLEQGEDRYQNSLCLVSVPLNFRSGSDRGRLITSDKADQLNLGSPRLIYSPSRSLTLS